MLLNDLYFSHIKMNRPTQNFFVCFNIKLLFFRDCQCTVLCSSCPCRTKPDGGLEEYRKDMTLTTLCLKNLAHHSYFGLIEERSSYILMSPTLKYVPFKSKIKSIIIVLRIGFYEKFISLSKKYCLFVMECLFYGKLLVVPWFKRVKILTSEPLSIHNYHAMAFRV